MAPAAPDSVTLAYVHDVEVAYSWHASVLSLIGYDMGADQRVVRGGWVGVRYGTGGIVDARNKVVRQFMDGSDPWLFWTDTDMGFQPDTVDRLLASADPVDRPIVGALCFAQRETEIDGYGGFSTRPVPTTFQWGEDDQGRSGFTPWWDYPTDTLVAVAATGSACILIHRSVFEAIADQYGPVWYEHMTNPTTGQRISEDLSFCARAAACGITTHVDTSVKTTHLKHLWLGEDSYRAS